jgi:hypothetical protein
MRHEKRRAVLWISNRDMSVAVEDGVVVEDVVCGDAGAEG